MESKVKMTLGIGNRKRGPMFCILHPASCIQNDRVRSKGLTLIEILISIAILAGGSVMVMQALARGAYALSVATNRMRVYEFSRAKMADLDITLERNREPKPRGRFRMGRESFNWSVVMLPTSDPELQQVTLTVTWDQGRQTYASEFSTVTRIEDEEGVL